MDMKEPKTYRVYFSKDHYIDYSDNYSILGCFNTSNTIEIAPDSICKWVLMGNGRRFIIEVATIHESGLTTTHCYASASLARMFRGFDGKRNQYGIWMEQVTVE